MLLNDKQIAKLNKRGNEKDMIYPFVSFSVNRLENGQNIPSYGLSSYGYDIRLGKDFVLTEEYTPIEDEPIDVVNDLRDHAFTRKPTTTLYGCDQIILQPNQTILGCSMEHFNLPNNVMALCLGKSTLARMGLFVNVTPIEPQWRGILTIELSNLSKTPLRLYAGDGIAQLIFLRGKKPNITYATKHGKYMNQQGVTVARI